MDMSLVLIEERGLPPPQRPKRVDVWWRGQKNGSLMMILAYLLTRNWEWADTDVRVLRLIENEAGRGPAMQALEETMRAARLEATPQVVVSQHPFPEVLRRHSQDATCIFLGFDLPPTGQEANWHHAFTEMLNGLPTTILVHSRGREDLMA